MTAREPSPRMIYHVFPSSQQNQFPYRLLTSAPTSQYILVSCWEKLPALKFQHSLLSFTQCLSPHCFQCKSVHTIPPKIMASHPQMLPAPGCPSALGLPSFYTHLKVLILQTSFLNWMMPLPTFWFSAGWLVCFGMDSYIRVNFKLLYQNTSKKLWL